METETFRYQDQFEVIRGPEGSYSSKLVARKHMSAGTVLAVLGEECQPTNIKAYTSVQISEEGPQNSHIELGSELVYINHSCQPNVKFDLPGGLIGLKQSQWKLVALVDIKKSDALTFAYFSTEWDMDQPFDCCCGSANCLGRIQGAKYLPLEILDKYFINEHIKRLKASQSL